MDGQTAGSSRFLLLYLPPLYPEAHRKLIDRRIYTEISRSNEKVSTGGWQDGRAELDFY